MSTKRINVTTILPPSALFIGYVAENGVTNVEFDVSAWVTMYGSGTATLIMKRWGDANPYPIALEVDNEGLATWTISATDTAKTGFAYAQLRYEAGTKVKKSPIYTLKIGKSLGSPAEAPDQYEDWIDALTHLAAQAMAEALDIEDIPTDKTLTVDGGIADAKATGDALAEKVDAADYSSLSNRVGANTIALAEKADRSTTYTKAQVDQMISDVEVETDTTLSVSGAPADAKATGDALGALEDQFTEGTDKLKADLADVNESLYEDGDAVYIQKNTDSVLSLNSPQGYIHVKSTDNPIYTGKVNIIDLIGIKQGTFVDSASGATIEINGNEIYIHGTTTNGFRFNPLTGEFYTDSFTNHLVDYSALPQGSVYRYCFWEKAGYTMPSNVYIATRNSETGNIKANALSNHSAGFGLNDTYPQYFAIYTNSGIADINCKFTIGLKLDALTTSQGASIEQVAKSGYDTTAITTSGYYNLDVFTWTGADTVYDIVSTSPLLKPNPLTHGHVYAWFGDSLSQLKELPNLVASILEVTVHDCTFAGAPLTYGDPTKYQPTGFMSLCSQIVAHDFTPLSDAIDAQEQAGINVTEKRLHLATLQSLDFSEVTDVILLAGTNDFDNDYVNATKFVSGFTSALTALLTAYPHLMVYVFSPTWRGDKSEGVQTIPTMTDLVQLEKNVADAFSLPFYDLYHRSGINALTASIYLESDKLHPSAQGDLLLANKCAKFIQSN